MDPTIIGAGIGALGNLASAKMASDASKGMSRENMQWQQWMSSSAHQREVMDLRAAGLNPILSGTGGMGASTPTPQMGQVFDAKLGDAMTAGMTSSTARDVNRATADKLKQDKETSNAAEAQARADAALKSYDMNVRKSTEHLQQQQLETEKHKTEEQKWNASSARWLYESSKAQGKFDEKLEEYGPGTRFLLEILRGVRPGGRR